MSSGRRAWWLLALAGALLACESSSATDYEQARREMRDEARRDRERADNDRRGREIARRRAQLDQLFFSHFEGRVQPDIGCDMCPDLCGRVDLQPLPPAEFQAHFRESVMTIYIPGEHHKGGLAARELRRLKCMLMIGDETLVDALSGLMEPGEAYEVRIQAALDGIIEKILDERGYQVLRNMASGDDDAARLAEIYLEHLENGLYNYDPETW